DALIWMSHGSVDLEHMPDTGSLRNDLLALLKPYSTEFGERKLHVLAKLGSYFSAHPKASEEAIADIFDPWTAVNRCLMQRAIERGEISEHADIETACQIIIAVTSHRSLGRHKSFGNLDYATLLDNILLPALRHPRPDSQQPK
ncbi:MAG: TetR-like C-terminal domain-containing protein, partial [Polynucleobacter sp.]|nr:TetR-like C-terminal domain-containing protein [Polynucleobacter sp.]